MESLRFLPPAPAVCFLPSANCSCLLPLSSFTLSLNIRDDGEDSGEYKEVLEALCPGAPEVYLP
jgi:hypothetical protein